MSATWENFSQISKSEYVGYCKKYNWNLAHTVRQDLEAQNKDGIFGQRWTEEDINSIVNEITEFAEADTKTEVI